MRAGGNRLRTGAGTRLGRGLALALLLGAGCHDWEALSQGVADGGPADTGAGDANGAGDRPDSSSAPGCDWLAGPQLTGPPVPMDDLNTAFDEIDLTVSADGLTLYFGTNRPGGLGEADVWEASRPTTMDPFTVVGPLTVVSSPVDDSRLAATADGLEAVLHSNRLGTTDLFRTVRTTVLEPFGIPELIAEVSTDQEEWNPVLSGDGLAVYFSSPGPPSLGDGKPHLLVARRPDRGSAFGAPDFVPGVATFGSYDAGPTVTADERLIVWHSIRTGGQGHEDLWYATRASTGEPFDTPRPLTALNTPDNDWKPFLRADGCELWFSSNRAGGLGGQDFYRVEVAPP